jgi:hypothetical protein
MKIRALLLAAALTVAASISGCATLSAITTTQGVLLNDSIQLGTAIYISRAGGTAVAPAKYSPQQQARAQQVKNIAAEIQGFVSGGTVTVAGFDAAMATWIAKLNPAEQIIANALLQEIDPLIQAQLGNNVLNAAGSMAVKDVTNDIITAAKLYGAT